MDIRRHMGDRKPYFGVRLLELPAFAEFVNLHRRRHYEVTGRSREIVGGYRR